MGLLLTEEVLEACIVVVGGGGDDLRTTGEVGWGEVRWGEGWGEVGWRVRWRGCGPAGGQEETANGGMRVKRERSQSQSAMGGGCWTVGALPGIEWPGGVPSTYPQGPDPWDVLGSWRGGPPCGRWSGSRGRWGHGPSLRSGGGTGAWDSSQTGAGGGAWVRLGQQLLGWAIGGGGGHELLRPDDLLYHLTSWEAPSLISHVAKLQGKPINSFILQ